MTVRPARLPAALLWVAVALGVAGCAGTDAPQTPAAGSWSATSSSTASSAAADATPTQQAMRLELEVAGGQVVEEPGRAQVPVGTALTLVLTSDAPDEVHVHGYDLTTELVPGEPAELTFDATIPGVFEVELHDAGTVLLTLQVQ